MAAADAWASALTLVILIMNSYLPTVHSIELPKCLRLTGNYLRLGGMIGSVLHLFALALNHYFGTVYPLQHMRYVSGRLIKCTLLLLWTLPPVGQVLSGFFFEGQLYRSEYCCENVTVTYSFGYRMGNGTVFLLPLVLTVLLYFVILGKLLKKSRHPLIAHSHPVIKQNRKLFLTMLLLMGTLLVCWVPSLLSYMTVCSNGCALNPDNHPESLLIVISSITQVLIITKLFTNPLIYANRIVELRYALWRMHHSTWLSRTSNNQATKSTRLPAEFQNFVMNKRPQHRCN